MVEWSIRRYKLSDFNSDKFYSAINAWTKQHGCGITYFRAPPAILLAYTETLAAAISGTTSKSLIPKVEVNFFIASPGQLAILQTFSSFSICYQVDSILYAATTNHLPIECRELFNNFLAPWVLSQGGIVIDQQSLVLNSNRWICLSDHVRNLEKKTHTSGKYSEPVDKQNIQNVKVCLDSDFERIRTSAETIFVPLNVKITVRRSRTIEHTLDITLRNLKGENLNLGFKDIIGASILTEVERQRGRSYTTSEKLEYEVELSGDNACEYSLIWTDVWCTGTIKFTTNVITQVLPFRFRERSELEVILLKT